MEQLRNLSCMNSLSKILETYVLDKLRAKISLAPNQYGGIKGSGTNHFLLECWDRILTTLDTPDSAVALLSIDFSKAFNRMDHTECIQAMAKYGASTDTLKIVGSFLTGRKMRFKVNAAKSEERPVKGGSPQGTKLGNYLFIITINVIEEQMVFLPPGIPHAPEQGEEEDLDLLGLCKLAGRVCAVRRFDSGAAVSSTPRKLGTMDGVLCYFDESGRNNTIAL